VRPADRHAPPPSVVAVHVAIAKRDAAGRCKLSDYSLVDFLFQHFGFSSRLGGEWD
jgi:hypothetical protein